MPDPTSNIHDLRSRILQAADLEASGDRDGALALRPSPEELREGLRLLRGSRTVKASPKAKSKAAAAPIDLNDLFK